MWLLRSPNVRSIANKLRRQGVRLSEMYDIAGCRLIVSNLAEQDRVVQRLQGLFDATRIVDRREQPSYGYRAVHVIVRFEGRLHEIQIRTSLQHLWAQVSERAADAFGLAIKYGGGDELVRALLQTASTIVANEELSARQRVDDDGRRRHRVVQFLIRVADFIPKWRET